MRPPQRPWLETDVHISLTARQFCSHRGYCALFDCQLSQTSLHRQRRHARRFVSEVRTKAEFNNRTTCSRSVWRSVFIPTYLLRHHLIPILEEVTSVVGNKRNIPDRTCRHDLDRLLMHGAELNSYLGHGLPQKTSTRQGDAVATNPFPCPATGLKFMTSNLPGSSKSNDGDPNLNQRLRIRSKCPSSYSNTRTPLVLQQYQPQAAQNPSPFSSQPDIAIEPPNSIHGLVPRGTRGTRTLPPQP